MCLCAHMELQNLGRTSINRIISDAIRKTRNVINVGEYQQRE